MKGGGIMALDYNISTFNRLQLLGECANMQLTDETFKDLEKMLKIKILEEHKYTIYYLEKENAYRTYLPDESKPNKRRPIKRKSKEELEEAVISFYLELEKAKNRDDITLEELFKEWLIFKRDYTSVKPKTIQEYMTDYNKFIRNTELSKMCIKDITPKILIRFFRSITKDRTYTYKRITSVRSILNGIMSYAIEEELIIFNPVREVNLKTFSYKPVENQTNNVFSIEDVLKLLSYLKNIDNEPYALAIQLFFCLFIRIGELKAIRKEDINFEEQTIFLHNQALTERTLNDDFTFSPRTVRVSDQMKGYTSSGYRIQGFAQETFEILEKAFALNPNGTYLFEPNGKLMTTDRFNRKLKKYCEECGIEYHSSHKIRFFNASLAFLNGVPLNTLSRLLGHSQIATTMHYLRNVNTNDDIQEVFARIGLTALNNFRVPKGSNNFITKKEAQTF